MKKMLRKFKINIDGTDYMVEMEEIGGVPQTATPPVVPPIQEVAPAPVASATPGADAMMSPMPGAIFKVLVNVGDQVTENQPLLILEAMKMENEIVTQKTGVVTGIHVTQGQVVNAGDALITVE